ncbi:isochorismate synthase [Plebeiibacterium marinum]|uniref:isochorismate synthase n=1 Tax=Plebeiibacterium marinum TaxID=2992111 RepID=A0AAE3SJX1_9BACT|nr:isochorismate synthase [Plebeiobacterium marinum]MCW3805898.1 isochorismate synthase [Plebeiobacterium marinum]
MAEISQKKVLEYCIGINAPFAIYKNPGEEKITLLISEEVGVYGDKELSGYLKKSGFVIAPFDLQHDAGLFLKDDFVVEGSTSAEVFEAIKQIKTSGDQTTESKCYATYNSYEKQYRQLYKAIESGKIEKAILSRIKRVDGVDDSCAADLFYKLCSKYPEAYAFMYYTLNSGLWVGASPELLFKVENNLGTTVSLAGTISEGEHSQWQNKEEEEQQIVTDFVTDVLKRYGVDEADVDGPKSVKAGRLFHLKTIYRFAVNGLRDKLGDFVKDLHPTPAVCGLPKNEAMEVIRRVEEHMRSYYAGFIGRINNGNVELFVNIRCMKFNDGGVDMFLGGGITVGSKPEQEWNETELKASTLLDVINEIKG